MLIHDDQAVHSGSTDGVQYGVQAIFNGAGIDTREVLEESIFIRMTGLIEILTGERFFNASPTVRLRSS